MRLLQSKRGHLYLLERSRIYVRDERVEYASEHEETEAVAGFNIPVANTSFLLIGPGSSITTEAVRILRGEGVMIGFCGSGGSPLLAANDNAGDFILPQDEYRDPSYLQRWIAMWQDEAKRFDFAKHLMLCRADNIADTWRSRPPFDGPWPAAISQKELADFRMRVNGAKSTVNLFEIEANFTRLLYKTAARCTGIQEFARDHDAGASDYTNPNALLNHGNYIAYGFATMVLWTLGIPHSFPVMHGKTRRGALVFDVADIIKDAFVLPTAFNCAFRMKSGSLTANGSTFRSELLTMITQKAAVDRMFDAIKAGLDDIG